MTKFPFLSIGPTWLAPTTYVHIIRESFATCLLHPFHHIHTSSPSLTMPTAISIHPAHPVDIPQIHAIFAHYVSNTVLTFTLPPLSLDLISARLHTVTQMEKMPYLVAVETPGADNDAEAGEGNLGAGEGEGQKRMVVGYAYTGGVRGSMEKHAFDHTTELSIFVKRGFERRGVGSALMAGILRELREINLKLGVGVGGGKGAGPPVEGEIRNVLAIMSVDEEGWKGGLGLRDWYVNWGFTEVGRMKGVGWKLGRWVDVVTLQLEL
jgi:L-amino acid N-acyltransferase YncA